MVCPQISTTSLTSPPSLQQDYHFQTADGRTESISQSPNAWNCRQSASEVIRGNDIMWQKCVFTRPGQATRGNIHKINTPIQQQEINRIFLNSFNKITHQMCTFKAGMLERSVVGPQIPLGETDVCMYVCCCMVCYVQVWAAQWWELTYYKNWGSQSGFTQQPSLLGCDTSTVHI